VRHEQAPLLSSYLSSPMVGHCLSVYDLSSAMCCHVLGFDYPILYLHLFKASLLFFTSEFLPCFLVSFLPFLCLKRLVCAKLFTKLGYCRILCSFLSGQVVNCPQRSLNMLLSKLTLGATKPLTRPEKVLPMWPRSAIDGGPPCLSLVSYPKRATG
jgi:hypothetical protein